MGIINVSRGSHYPRAIVLLHVDDSVLTSSYEVSNACKSILPQENLSSVPTMVFLFVKYHISVEEVANLLNNLNHHKATKPDNIPTYFLKQLSTELAPIQSSQQPGRLNLAKL